MANPRIIAIAGMSACGKTTLAQDLARSLNAPILAMDNYYHDIAKFNLQPHQVAELNWDHLDAFRTQDFGHHIATLAAGNPIDVPTYDFNLSKPTSTQTIQPTQFMILEGQFTLCIPEVIEFAEHKLFVDLDLRSSLRRRLHRDTTERGRTPESINQQWKNHVLPAWNTWVSPSRRLADQILLGDDDRETNVERILSRIHRIPSLA